MSTRHWPLVGFTLIALLLSACGAGSATPRPQSVVTSPPMVQTAVMQPTAAPPAVAEAPSGGRPAQPGGGGSGSTGNLPAASQRLVIRNATLTLVVADTGEAVDKISALATQMGGYVVASQSAKVKDQPTRGSITIRVPAEQLDVVLRQIEALAKEVRDKRISGQDVTEEYTDLESRKRNLEAAEAQLQAIMQRAGSIEEVLTVQRQLVETREEIEKVKGRMQYLEQASAFSSITVELIPDVLPPTPTPTPTPAPVVTEPWRASATAEKAIASLTTTLQGLADVVIWLGLYVLPILLILGIPFGVVYAVLRRSRGRIGPTPA